MTSSPPAFRRQNSAFWPVVALTFASVALLGYNFGEGNLSEQLPLVLRALDPNYLRQDWIVNANQGFNHRWFYTTTMAFLARFLGVEGAFFLGFLASLTAWTTGISALVRSIWPDDEKVSIAAVVAPLLLHFSEWGTISNTLIFNNLIPGLPSLALAAWFGVILRREKLLIAAVLLLAAGLIHAQIGPFSGIFLLIGQFYALQTEPETRRRLLRHFPLWLLGILLPLGLALISDDKRALTPAQSREALDVLTYLRHPHHYVPMSWSSGQWWREIAWLSLIFVARAIAKPSRFLDGILLATLLFCLSGWLPFVANALFPLVKLQHFRMSIWLQIAGSIYIACLISVWWNHEIKPRRVAAILIFSAFVMPLIANAPGAYLLLLPLSLAAFTFASRRLSWPSLLFLLPWLPFWVQGRADASHFGLKIVLTAFFAVFAWMLIALAQNRLPIARRASQIAFALCGLAFTAVFLHPPRRLARFNRVQTRIVYPNPDGPMEEWLRTNTPPDAVFLIPPTLESFRLKANRAVVVDFKVFPWSDAGLLDWRRRIDAVLGEPLPLGGYKPAVLDAHYAKLSAAQVEKLAQNYGAGYFVVPAAASGDFTRFTPIYFDQKWRVYRLGSPFGAVA